MRPLDETRRRALLAAGVPPTLAPILAARGAHPADWPDFDAPTLRVLMPDPLRLADMDRAVARIAADIRGGRCIGIWSDYDVDGACAAAIFGRFLRMAGHGEAPLRIPDRFREGYGPNPAGLREMREDGCDTVVILDAGTTAFEAIEAGRAAGLEIVVVDHHAAEAELPAATALVNPNRRDDVSGLGHLCAAGVTFMFCVALARELRDGGWFDGREGRPDRVPDLMSLLDLAALATVCDVVPLVDLNRAFVMQGLKRMRAGLRPALAALAEFAGVKSIAAIDEADCGWRFGPRINAGGRIAESDLGARLLLADDAEVARGLAEKLEICNRERRRLEAEATQAALAGAADLAPGAKRVAVVTTQGHEGVVGIAAARVKDALDLPAVVLAATPEGVFKGSARSPEGFDIGAALIAARRAGLAIKAGGHARAGGVTLAPDRLEEFRAFLDAAFAESPLAAAGVAVEIDLALTVGDLDPDLVAGFSRLAPFGAGNPAPLVMIRAAVLAAATPLKETHLRLRLADGEAAIDGLLWGVRETDFGRAVMALAGRRVDVVGRPQTDTWRGEARVQLMVEDLRPAADHLL